MSSLSLSLSLAVFVFNASPSVCDPPSLFFWLSRSRALALSFRVEIPVLRRIVWSRLTCSRDPSRKKGQAIAVSVVFPVLHKHFKPDIFDFVDSKKCQGGSRAG